MAANINGLGRSIATADMVDYICLHKTYPMTNIERIHIEIEKQVNAGFSAEEIRQNLLLQQYSTAEINEGLKRVPASAAPEKSSSKTGFVSILISVFFIISGSMRMNSEPSGSTLHTWGIILVIVGVVGVVWKSYDAFRK
jgi:hypothetical protein